jgi:ubiquinone/menaquinone biosynthesis C-methylase UbiE
MDRVMARQADDVFEEEFLASLYDYFNTWDACDDFYLGLAQETGGRVLELGCGTGMLACRIAEEGLAVTGVDPAEGMLRVARSRQGTERVCWIKADGQTLRLPLRFDLIYMTGHAFQALLTDDDAIAVLRTAHEHLTGDGRFAFESRNPAST